MTYLRVPREIGLDELRRRDFSWSAGMYQRVEIPTASTRLLGDLLHGYDKGHDPGSVFYVPQSPYYFIRTKALQPYSDLISRKGDAITPLSPKAFKDMELSDGDILLSKDSNIGECAMVDGDTWRTHTLSGGVLRLRPMIDRHYLLAFLKHPLFTTELRAKVPRGATIAHANDLWLECHIPFPNQTDGARVVAYVGALMQAIVEKQIAIRERQSEIFRRIESELLLNQRSGAFRYSYPTSDEVRATTRLDTGLYCRGFQEFQQQVRGYRKGATTLSELGIRSRRGPNLAVSVIGKALYSETYMRGWYELIRPVNVSEFGTLNAREWLGSSRNLPVVSGGDLILGCEGFEKGRSLVLIEAPQRCTTNFHGTVLSWPGSTILDMAFVHCYFSYLRRRGVIDWVGVGGSGGHMSPEYFDYLPFPKFDDATRHAIATLYHSAASAPSRAVTIDGLVEWHREWNVGLGIWELDRELNKLRVQLRDIQQQIIEGGKVVLSVA